MKVTALRLFNVKRFAGRGVAIEGIDDGVNVLCAVNEFGKSTSFEALHALFFQPHSSTGADVRNLRPYSGGNPLVEADIATEDGAFRITKQFYGRGSVRVVDLATGRLVAQADEAEQFIAGIVRGGTAGPAGLLWVRQGVTGIEKRSKSEEEGETRVRSSLLQSVQGEVEAVTGGRRMSEIMDAVDAALAKLVTPTGRPKSGEPYFDALAERDRLSAEEARLATDLRSLREALDARASASRRLADLVRDQDRDAQQRAIAAAEAAYDAAKSHAEALRAARAELGLIGERRDNAHREHVAFLATMDREAGLASKLVEAEGRRRAAQADREAATIATTAALRAVETAEAEEQEARALLARLNAAMSARDAAARLSGLERQLADAEAIRAQIEAEEAALVLLKLPDKAIAALEALDIEIARHKAVAEAGRPSIAIVYEPDALPVTLDGQALKHGESRSYGAAAELVIPGVGRVALRSGRVAVHDAPLEQSETRRRALLDSMGVADLAAARRRQEAFQRKQAELREAQIRLSLLAPDGLPKLHEAAAAAQRVSIGETLELKGDPAEAEAAQREAGAKLSAARQARRATEPLQAAASQALIDTQTILAGLNVERAHISDILGPEETRADRAMHLAKRLAGLDAQLAEQQGIVKHLQERAIDLEAAEASVRRLRSVAAQTEGEAIKLRETIAGLTAEIRARSDDAIEEKWSETVDALAAVKQRITAFEKDVAVLQKLRQALEAARSQARETYLLPVMRELRPLLSLLFDDVSISFDEKTLLPQKIVRAGQEEDVDRLSGGMREQLSVLARLAFARLLARDGRPAPVILDDALVYSDDDRIEKMFDALHRQAREQQIIVFSCRQRAFQKLGGKVLHMADWTPDA